VSDQFPVYLKVENDLQGLTAFERAMESATDKAKTRFARSMEAVGASIEQTFAKAAAKTGQLDFNTGGFRQAAAEARLYSEAISTTLKSEQLLAMRRGDASAATQSYLNHLSALSTQAKQSEDDARA